jgi:hypothetical protein
MPLRSLGTTLIATSAITGLSSPTPTPASRKLGSNAVQSESASSPDMASMPTAASASAADISTRAGTRGGRPPAIGATRKTVTVIGRYRTPASSGEWPRKFCR